MSSKTTRSAANRMALLGMATFGLGSLGACQGVTEPLPQTPLSFDREVVTRVSTPFATAGDEVRLVIVVDDADALLRASVNWDANLFEFSHALPGDDSANVFGDPDRGWIMLESNGRSARAEGWLELVFVALVDAETSSFAADATLIPHMEGEGDLLPTAN